MHLLYVLYISVVCKDVKYIVCIPVQDRLPLPPSDMVLTFADITTSKKVLGFSPRTSTAEGILNEQLYQSPL